MQHGWYLRSAVAVACNAILVGAPAVLVTRGEVLRGMEFWGALAGLSLVVVMELAAQSSARVLSTGSTGNDRLATRFNAMQGLVLLVSLAGLIAAAGLDDQRPQGWIVATGFLVLVMAGVLRRSAITQLGSGFSDGFQPQGEVVRTGLYNWLRHPAELGLVLLPVGVAMMLGISEWLPIAWPAVLVTSAARIGQEEYWLRQAKQIAHTAVSKG